MNLTLNQRAVPTYLYQTQTPPFLGHPVDNKTTRPRLCKSLSTHLQTVRDLRGGGARGGQVTGQDVSDNRDS
jgi:hypothetical protein